MGLPLQREHNPRGDHGDAAPHTRSRHGVARWVWDPPSAAVLGVQHPPAPPPAEPQKTPGAGSALTRGQRMCLQEPLAQGRSLLFVPQISRDHLQLHQHPRSHPDPPPQGAELMTPVQRSQHHGTRPFVRPAAGAAKGLCLLLLVGTLGASRHPEGAPTPRAPALP